MLGTALFQEHWCTEVLLGRAAAGARESRVIRRGMLKRTHSSTPGSCEQPFRHRDHYTIHKYVVAVFIGKDMDIPTFLSFRGEFRHLFDNYLLAARNGTK